MISWIVNFLIKQVLVRLGASSGLASALTPRLITLIKDAIGIAKDWKAAGASDEVAALVADELVLRPRAPEKVFADRLTEIGG